MRDTVFWVDIMLPSFFRCKLPWWLWMSFLCLFETDLNQYFLLFLHCFCCCCLLFAVFMFCLFVSPCPFLPLRILDLFTFICLCTHVSLVLCRVRVILSSIDPIILNNCMKQWSLIYVWVPYTLFLCPSSAASTAVSTTRDSYWFYNLISISVLCYIGQHSGL